MIFKITTPILEPTEGSPHKASKPRLPLTPLSKPQAFSLPPPRDIHFLDFIFRIDPPPSIHLRARAISKFNNLTVL